MTFVSSKIILNNGIYGDVIDIDIDGSSMYFTMQRLILTLVDSSSFSLGSYIVGDGDNGNDGIGIVRQKMDGNKVVVQQVSGSFITNNGVDNANPYVGDETTISLVEQTVSVHRQTYAIDTPIGNFF